MCVECAVLLYDYDIHGIPERFHVKQKKKVMKYRNKKTDHHQQTIIHWVMKIFMMEKKPPEVKHDNVLGCKKYFYTSVYPYNNII